MGKHYIDTAKDLETLIELPDGLLARIGDGIEEELKSLTARQQELEAIENPSTEESEELARLPDLIEDASIALIYEDPYHGYLWTTREQLAGQTVVAKFNPFDGTLTDHLGHELVGISKEEVETLLRARKLYFGAEGPNGAYLPDDYGAVTDDICSYATSIAKLHAEALPDEDWNGWKIVATTAPSGPRETVQEFDFKELLYPIMIEKTIKGWIKNESGCGEFFSAKEFVEYNLDHENLNHDIISLSGTFGFEAGKVRDDLINEATKHDLDLRAPEDIPFVEHLSEETIGQVMAYMEIRYNGQSHESWIDADMVAETVLDGVADNFGNNGGDLVWDQDAMIDTYLNGEQDDWPAHVLDEVRGCLSTKVDEYRPYAASQILDNIVSDYNSGRADIADLTASVKEAMERTGLKFDQLTDILSDVPPEALKKVQVQVSPGGVDAPKVAPTGGVRL